MMMNGSKEMQSKYGRGSTSNYLHLWSQSASEYIVSLCTAMGSNTGMHRLEIIKDQRFDFIFTHIESTLTNFPTGFISRSLFPLLLFPSHVISFL